MTTQVKARRQDAHETALPKVQHRASAAFTLVELLVVIAVLALLTALLVPSFKKARDMAMEGACKANLRNWGIGFLAYASDHKGFLPHPDGQEREVKGTDTGNEGYMDLIPPYLGDRPRCDYPQGQKPTHGFWQCPAARVAPELASRPNGYFSYAMNSYLAHDFSFGLPWGVTPQPSFLFLGRVAAPAQTILMFEQTLNPDMGYGGSGGLGSAGQYGAEDARAVTERHAHTFGGLGGNVLYLDGHVDWRDDLWDEELRNPRMPPRGDLTWFPYPY